ncbi:MAG: two-component system sensor histidine kinase [Verrucomicrobiaceae bacterium]|nr:two-component system sensor histidine kinase [Verrucomicrobiaceae bacterium]
MLKTLQGKLMLLIIALLCGMGVLFFYIQMYSFGLYQDAVSQSLNKDLAATLTQRFLNKNMGWADMPEQLQRQFDQFMAINPDIEVYLIDGEGKVVGAASGVMPLKTRVDIAPVKQFVGGEMMFPLLGEDPAHAMRSKVFSAAAIDTQHPEKGYLYVILGGHSRDAVAQRLEVSLILRQGMWFMGLGLIAALVFGIGTTLFLTRWLKHLVAAMQPVERGQPLELVPHFASLKKPGDEIDKLGHAYNAMATQINNQLRELQKTDIDRRELIASVSHDLRTPLAALRGYLETLLLKDSALSNAERRNYLEIAFKQSQRMSVLINELFELTKLEAGDTHLNSEPFQLAELAHDVVQKFELTASQREIELIARISRATPFVNGDIALIERVLENLLDNALRHTAAGGQVEVTVHPQRQSIQVQVRDTGSGIPEKDLPYVFDRFYRVDKSRNEYSGGAGLGLAIAKRVIELHGGAIEVASEAGSGTCFTFTLPVQRVSPAVAIN